MSGWNPAAEAAETAASAHRRRREAGAAAFGTRLRTVREQAGLTAAAAAAAVSTAAARAVIEAESDDDAVAMGRLDAELYCRLEGGDPAALGETTFDALVLLLDVLGSNPRSFYLGLPIED